MLIGKGGYRLVETGRGGRSRPPDDGEGIPAVRTAVIFGEVDLKGGEALSPNQEASATGAMGILTPSPKVAQINVVDTGVLRPPPCPLHMIERGERGGEGASREVPGEVEGDVRAEGLQVLIDYPPHCGLVIGNTGDEEGDDLDVNPLAAGIGGQLPHPPHLRPTAVSIVRLLTTLHVHVHAVKTRLDEGI